MVSSVMLPKLKKRMKSWGVGIMILNVNSFHMSFYGDINPRVYFTKDLQQHLICKDLGILDSTITLSQMPKWTQTLAGIKDHSHTSAETMNAYDADY